MIVSDCPHDDDWRSCCVFSSTKHSINLAKLLKDSDIQIQDVYITSLVKCLPNSPGSKHEMILKKEYINACQIYLQEEISTVEPELIILLGEKVFSYFFPDLIFTDNRGKIIKNSNFNIDTIGTYNPVSMAYTNKFDQIIKSDFVKAREKVYGSNGTTESVEIKKDYRFPLNSLNLLEALNKKLKEVETFAVDIETHGSGLFNYKLLSIGFSYKEHTGVSVPVWVRDDEKVSALEKVLGYVIPVRYKEEVSGVLKDGRPRVKKTPDKEFKDLDRFAIKDILPEEYWYLTDLPTLREIKQQIRGILDKEPPLKKYWGDQHDRCMQLIKEIMENDTPKGFHNGGYDVNRLRGIGITTKNYAWDTILMHHLLDEERPHNLDDLSFVYTKDGGYKSGKNIYLKSTKTSWANIPANVLLPYNAQDADVTLQLYHIFKERLKNQGRLWNLFETHVMPAQRMLLDMSFRGSDVDINWINKTQKEYRARMKDLVLDFQDDLRTKVPGVYVVANKEEEDALVKELNAIPENQVKPEIINLNSTAHMVHVFRDIYGCKMTKKTATGDALDSNVLKKFAKKLKIAKILLEYKELAKLDSTYLTGMRESIDTDNKIHGTFVLYGTVTGRLASREPNMQNISGDMKYMFIPPKGYLCVNVDQSAAELHVLGWCAQDKKMIDIFEHRRDLHRETAAGVFKKKPEEISDEERKIAKRVSFGTAYDISGKGLADLLEPEGVKITENQGNKYIEAWRATYKNCARFLDEAKKIYKSRGYLENPFGRRRHKYKVFTDTNKESSSSRQACNYPIQSTASDIQIHEMIHMYPELIKNGVLPVFTVHDSIVMYCPVEKLKWLRDYYAKETCRRFSNEEFPGLNNCLMYTEMEVGRNYGEHVKLPYDCDFDKWKEENGFLFDTNSGK